MSYDQSSLLSVKYFYGKVKMNLNYLEVQNEESVF
jgi:hypothetical protein